MKSTGLQEMFLNAMRTKGVPATFFLVNGFQFKGMLKAFDDYTLVIECGNMQEMIFKHAISTIIPSQHIDISPVE